MNEFSNFIYFRHRIWDCWMSQMDSGMMSVGRTTSPLGGAVGKLSHLEIQQIKQPKMHCGDCNSDDCQWASINRGVYLCDQCAIIHREMGRHYSQVSPDHETFNVPTKKL